MSICEWSSLLSAVHIVVDIGGAGTQVVFRYDEIVAGLEDREGCDLARRPRLARRCRARLTRWRARPVRGFVWRGVARRPPKLVLGLVGKPCGLQLQAVRITVAGRRWGQHRRWGAVEAIGRGRSLVRRGRHRGSAQRAAGGRWHCALAWRQPGLSALRERPSVLHGRSSCRTPPKRRRATVKATCPRR